MIPWRQLASASIPAGSADRAADAGGALTLWQRGDEFSIRIGPMTLMTSREHDSEESLAARAIERCREKKAPRVLIGGLGMGFTLAAALRAVPARAEVVVAELVPAVEEWNRGPLSHLAGHPLRDARTRVHVGDVTALLRGPVAAWDCALLDVDNGPSDPIRGANARLYSDSGLHDVHAALRPGGVLAVWSVHADKVFAKRLRRAGFEAEELRLATRPGQKAKPHAVWLGLRRN
jgi:spermidine synthase